MVVGVRASAQLRMIEKKGKIKKQGENSHNI
jgi:hypothetical protein